MDGRGREGDARCCIKGNEFIGVTVGAGANALWQCWEHKSAGISQYFQVWAPQAKHVVLQLNSETVEMTRDAEGIFRTQTTAKAGDRYSYVVDGSKPLPDPVSRLLPEGVHGPTEIVNPDTFQWGDEKWRGAPYSDYVLYELHVGTFTPEGTFDGVIGRLPYLKELGVTAIEVCRWQRFRGDGIGDMTEYRPTLCLPGTVDPRAEAAGRCGARARFGGRAGRDLQPPGRGR